MDGNLATKPKVVEQAPQPQPNLRERVQSLRLPDDESSPGGARRRWIWLIVLFVVAVGGYVAYSQLATRDDQQSPAQKSVVQPPAQSVGNSHVSASSAGGQAQAAAAATPSNTAGAVASSGEIAHESKGYIIPAHQILVSPKVPGMLTMLKIEEGQRVKKDDILAQLETTDYEADQLGAGRRGRG